MRAWQQTEEGLFIPIEFSEILSEAEGDEDCLTSDEEENEELLTRLEDEDKEKCHEKK